MKRLGPSQQLQRMAQSQQAKAKIAAALNRVTDLEVIAQMETLGGSFVKALANAARHADVINLSKIKATFSDYWKTYAEHARRARERKGGTIA
jgi:hypothetical protein